MGTDQLKRILFKGDKIIWAVFFFICAISVVEVFSATSRQIGSTGNYWHPIIKHASFLAFGVFVVWFIHNMKVRQIKKLSYVVYWIGMIGIIWAQFDSGSKINGSARWISLFGFTFQPMEFAKMGIVMVTALILSEHQDQYGTKDTALKKILIYMLPPTAIILKENLSTAGILLATVYMMMYIARVPRRQLLKILGFGAGIGVLGICLIMITPDDVAKGEGFGNKVITWKNRIKDMGNSKPIDPDNYVIEDDQRAHANMAIASSHIIGCGPGNSVQRDNIPHAYSDFIYAIILEELGLIGGVFVIMLYLTLLFRSGKIANKCEEAYPAYLSMGIGLIIVMQAMLHMYISVGDFITGQPLPLISQGGTSVVINCVYIGMLLCISRNAAAKKSSTASE